MKRILLFFTLLLVWMTGFSQIVIRPSQYKVRFEVSFPAAAASGWGYYKTDLGVQVHLLDAAGTNTIAQAQSEYLSKVDSLNVIEASNQPKWIRFFHKVEVAQEYCDYDWYNDRDYCYYNYDYPDERVETLPLRYPFMDTTVTTSYGAVLKAKVEPILDISYNLPSHEKINLVATGGNISNPVWKYQVDDGEWITIPEQFYSIGGLNVSGIDLFGGYYASYINKTVKIKVQYKNGYNIEDSRIAAFTHRLSAPHITSITPSNILCYGEFNGSMLIRFDRPLYDGERLNLFLNDTVTNAYFSVLNIRSLESGNTLTWPAELPKGVYFLSMIGKYDTGIDFDLTYYSRDASKTEYKARRSITFEPGFESFSNDYFEAYIDTTAVSNATYTGSKEHYRFVTLIQPTRIQFTINKQNDVRCKGGADGALNIYAKGGVGSYRYRLTKNGSPTIEGSFTSNTPNPSNDNYVHHLLTGLSAGNYTISIRDGNNCQLKDSVGNEIAFGFFINEPATEVRQDLLEVTPITSSELTNGIINVNITGGTPNLNGQKYSFEWRDSATNNLVSSYQVESEANKYTIRLGQLKEGTYVLRAFDVNGTGYTNVGGCNLTLKVPISKPQPLLVSLSNLEVISCNAAGNGKLKALPTGGHRIDSLGYKFQWFKDGVTLTTTSTIYDSVLQNVVPGNYEVEVEDKYGNKKRSAVFAVTQPVAMQLTLGSTTATCYSNPSGSVSATATGGTAPYIYEWSTGERGQSLTNLPGGSYFVVVRDSRGCEATGQVSITSPVQVIVTPTITPVTCLGKADGRISLSTTGGGGGYSYTWSNGATGPVASGLAPGKYWYKVADANGCYTSDTLEMDTPEVFTMSLDADRNMCVGQKVILTPNVTSQASLVYNWTSNNGFLATTPTATITQAGTYMVSVSNSRNCVLRDTIVLTPVSNTIHTDYIVSTQAYKNESLVLINMSNPTADSVQWITPALNGLKVVQKSLNFCELRFADTGSYTIGMKAFYNSGCIDLVQKQVIVLDKGNLGNLGDQAAAYLKKFTVYPNPNSGQFTVGLEFNAITKARLRFINTLNNVLVNDRTVEGSKDYNLAYNYGGQLIGGTYILIIETAKGNFVYKVVVQ